MNSTPIDDVAPPHRVSSTLTGRLLTITLDRSAASNALDEEMGRALLAALRPASGPDVGAVLLRSNGGNFCVGGDLRAFAQGPESLAGMPERVRATVDVANEFILALADLDVPVVSALQGWVAGIGVSIGCRADIIIAGESTKFRSAYTAIGFTPDGGLSWLLPHLVGAARTADFVLSNRVLDAAEALSWGLVSRVVPDPELASAAEELAGTLALAAPGAQAQVLRLLRRGQREDLAEALATEADFVVAQAGSAEGREGVSAFLAKRVPDFHPSDAAAR